MNSDDVKQNEQKTEIETEEYDPLTTCPTCGQELSSFDAPDMKPHYGCTTPYCPNLDPYKKELLKWEYSIYGDDNTGEPIPLTDQEFDAMLGTKERYEITIRKEMLKKMGMNPAITGQVPYEEGLIPKIERYFETLFGDLISSSKKHMIACFVVSTQLGNCQFENKIGKGRPNLAIIELGESGVTFKTPVLERLTEIIGDRDSNCYDRLDSFTTSAYKKSAVKWIDKFNKKFYWNVSIEHEMSTVFNENSVKSSFNSLAEHFCNMLDGHVSSRDTVTNGRTDSFFTFQCYYGAATQDLLNSINVHHWDQGFANRPFYIWTTARTELPDDLFDETNIDLISMKESIRREFPDINKIEIAVFDKKDLRSYREDWKRKMDNVNNCERGTVNRLKAVYAFKQMKNILKLACIYAASRHSYIDDTSTKKRVLYPQADDIERAIQTVNQVIPSAGKAIEESIKKQTSKKELSEDVSDIFANYKTYIREAPNDERYIVTGNAPSLKAEINEKGEWVRTNYVLWRSNMKKLKFEEILNTLKERSEVVSLTARTHSGKLVDFIRLT